MSPLARSALVAAAAVVVAWAGTAWALDAASGATRIGGPDSTSYETEFIADPHYSLTALAVLLLVATAAWWRWLPAGLGLAGSVAALWWGGMVTVNRYGESGWSDGLEVFVFLNPIGTAVLGLILIPLSRLAAKGRRSGRRNAADENQQQVVLGDRRDG